MTQTQPHMQPARKTLRTDPSPEAPDKLNAVVLLGARLQGNLGILYPICTQFISVLQARFSPLASKWCLR